MFILNEYNKIFKKIKKGAKIAIYGTKDTAIGLKRELDKRRKDVKLVCFLNSDETGSIGEIPIYSPFETKNICELVDTVIVSSFHSAYIIKLILNSCGIKNILYVSKKLVEYEDNRKFEEVKKILADKKDKYIYNLVIAAKLDPKKNKKVAKYTKKYLPKRIYEQYINQYFDYINKDAIKVVMDCGAHDALQSIMFTTEFPNIKKVYTFEPLYNQFKKDVLDNIIKLGDKIEIVEKAIWKEKTTLEFRQETDMPAASAIIEAKPGIKRKHFNIKVEATSIDDFVKDNNIEKIDYIKMDIENAELDALRAAETTILKDRPQLAISIYHSMEHFWKIPLYLHELLDDYVFKIGQYETKPTETVLYAIPKELYKK